MLTGLVLLGSAFAANETLPARLLDLGNGVIGGLYRPSNPGPRANVAVFVMHAEQDYLNFVACTELYKRGYTALCANNNASKFGKMTDLAFEDMLQNAGSGISYLRNQTYIDKVVALGHSGGGAMLWAYQNIAENGVSACNGPEKLYPCSDDLANLPAADGFISVNANYVNDDLPHGLKINASLNLYNPANGYTSNGANYSTSFRKAYQSGVVARWNCIIDHALSRSKAIAAGNSLYADDEPLTIPDANKEYSGNKSTEVNMEDILFATEA
ncbi:hypothetical protein SI65_07784 [Aspergillus cristatus]|uniref:Alpha/beta hydrolase n=1 Tax=Aspergillus cristatus TaxID=573508 RepID=A0A1E3B7B0_ASPCR|nr:hypothetical protein SI65_07784 [Aspergillus cristatus]